MRSLLYAVILIIATACTLSVSRTRELDEARTLMQSDPSAALSKLNSMDVSEFHDSATMAQWALLYSEAMVINRLSAPTDTIVDIAVDYYRRHNLADEFEKASRLKSLIHSSTEPDDLAAALYLQKEKEFFLYKERAKRELYTFIGLFILFVAGVAILWMRQRMKFQSLQNEALIAEASCLKCQIDAGRNDVGRLKSKLQGLLENRFALIDSLCQTYYESQGTKVERKAVIDKVKCEIESVRTDSFPVMEQAVNDCLDNILEKVKIMYPGIKPEDYQLLVYIAGGLSTRTISLLLSQTTDVIYKRKSRLKSHIKNFVAPA
ncbi:MAG: hypothetical protein K2H98_05830, partial [Duncaniella sp.]|nr:hypothetical protein [Duncaniella sp.]